MKISFNWLKEFVEISKTSEELADDLSLFGQEVDGIEKVGDDSVLDFEITPNRGDCLSVLGMAREIAALYNTKIKNHEIKIENDNLDKKIDIKIEKPDICPRFTARIIDNITISESPKWMQEKLATYGFRPINNIVDVTNYVMVATGQPLHAFDFDKIKGLMNVRLSKKSEEVMTLDGKNHILPEDAIIIEDKEKIYDLTGIMGGYKSEVDEKTKTIILQGAVFDPVLIRRASKYLHHQTDASYRYERGVDYEGTILGVNIAASLIKESCDAKVGELIDIKSKDFEPTKIDIDLEKINHLIGIDIDNKKTNDFLERLGFKVKDNIVTVPSYRSYDVKIWQDIAEEVARIYGYNNIEKNQIEKSSSKINEQWQKREIIKDICKENGFTEVYSYSFADKDKIELLGFNLKDCVETSNPIAPELKYLRPSLLPSLLEQIAKNPWDPEIRIFEIEKVFDQDPSADEAGKEWFQLGIAVSGKQEEYLRKVIDTFKIKADIKNIDQKILDVYKIRRPVKYIIVDLDDIANDSSRDILYKVSSKKYKSISKFPPTVRDLSFVVAKNVDECKVVEEIKNISQNILLVELFDVYKMEQGKSLAVHIWLQDLKKPLDSSEANAIMKRIIEKIGKEFQATLRQ